MAWFKLSRESLSEDELRTALFDAVAGGDARKVTTLVKQHGKRIAVLFSTWTTLPEHVRSDPARMNWWAEGVIGVAKASAALGDASLMALLVRSVDENIVVVWQTAFVAARSHATEGNYGEAIRILEDMLTRTQGLKGSAVDDLLPKPTDSSALRTTTLATVIWPEATR